MARSMISEKSLEPPWGRSAMCLASRVAGHAGGNKAVQIGVVLFSGINQLVVIRIGPLKDSNSLFCAHQEPP